MKRAICAIVVGAVAVVGCGRKPTGAPAAPEPAAPKKKPAPVVGVAKDIRVIQADAQGRTLYEVRSKGSTQTREDATLNDTRVTLYHNGQPDMLIVAPSARVDARTRDVVMWGGLSARALTENTSFRVDRLTWNANSKKFEGTGNVRYTRPPLKLTARRMTGRTPVQQVDFDGGVALEVTP